jgi:dihydrofolate synthase / folylpolyglutamate synthase
MTTGPEVIDALYARSGEVSPQPRLHATRRAMELIGDPQHMYGIVHLTGTNGKTSTARMIDQLLRAHGLRVGLMTSPHIRVLNERIVVDGEPVSDEVLAQNFDDVSPCLAMVDAELVANSEAPLTFFEALTVLTFAVFADAPVDVAVVEVGMGGEWDSTNVANADVAVITPIDLDHVEILGPTIRDIARTKSGIIKPATRVVSAAQRDDAMEEILVACDKNEAPLVVLGREFEVSQIQPGVGGQVVGIRAVAGEYLDIVLPLVGDHQADNAAVALAAVEQFLGGGERPLSHEVVEEAFSLASSPGRLQVLDRHPTILVDGAHNPHGAQALARSLTQFFAFDPLIAVLGVLQEKDVTGIVEHLDAVVDRFVITQSRSDRAFAPEDLAEVVSRIAGPDRIILAPHVDAAIDAAVQLAGSDGGVIVTGSITLVAEATDVVAKRSEGT